MEIKEKYNELKDKYNLPSFEELDACFEISNIEDKNLLRGIRKKIAEKIDFIHQVIEPFVQPDNSFSSLHEIDVFLEDDRIKLMALYKKIMILIRELVKLNLIQNEENDAKFVKGFYDEWKNMREEVLLMVEKAQSSWYGEDIKGFNIDYLG